jgi:hypothetical protein
MILLEKTGQKMGVEFVSSCVAPASINSIIRQDLISSKLEVVCIEIIKPHSRPFLVATVYRPPNASSEFFDYFEK